MSDINQVGAEAKASSDASAHAYSIGIEFNQANEPLVVLSDDVGHAISIPVEFLQEQIIEYRAQEAARRVRQAAKQSAHVNI